MPSPQVPAGSVAPDLFCCGQAFLGNGRLLVAGGTESWTRGHPGDPDPGGHHAHGHFTGLRYTWFFEPNLVGSSNPWRRAADMLPQRGRTVGGGRWYPTLVTLGDGRCLILAGHPSTTHTGEHDNRMLETFNSAPAPLGQWTDRGDLPLGHTVNLYPRLHVLPNGEVFCVTPIGGRCRSWRAVRRMRPRWRDIAPIPVDTDYHGLGTTSVLLPLLPHQNYEPRILLCGSSEPLVISPFSAAPAWETTSGPRQPIRGSNSRKRIHLNAVILPTMDVMICGGFDAAGPVREVELYHPNDDSWTTLPAAGTAAVARNYHSVALLMPDGRVWTAGGNDRGDWSYHNSSQYESPGPNQPPLQPLPTNAQDPGVDNRETLIELFEPPYFSRPDRPRITYAPSYVSYDTKFTIRTPDAGVISRVALIRAGSVTHAFNSDQRYVGLRFTRFAEELQATAPPHGQIAPPGYFLLFIVKVDGGQAVPSIGAFVRVGPQKTIKELKPEIKEKLELNEYKHLAPEYLEEKRIPDIPDPKAIREAPDPLRPDLFDPSPLLRLLAERIDDLEEKFDRGQAFIRGEERPEVGDKLLAEEAEAALTAREAAEAAARAAEAEGQHYHPAPAEGIQRGRRPSVPAPHHQGHEGDPHGHNHEAGPHGHGAGAAGGASDPDPAPESGDDVEKPTGKSRARHPGKSPRRRR